MIKLQLYCFLLLTPRGSGVEEAMQGAESVKHVGHRFSVEYNMKGYDRGLYKQCNKETNVLLVCPHITTLKLR